jgi:hypothetical protein
MPGKVVTAPVKPSLRDQTYIGLVDMRQKCTSKCPPLVAGEQIPADPRGSKMAVMSGPKGYFLTLDDDIFKAATEAANVKIDGFAKSLSADFAAAAAATRFPEAWEIEEFAEGNYYGGD